MARVLCISSQTVFGPVGNSAAAPVLQALGHEVLQIPTVVLSNHPGLGKPAGQPTPAALIEEMLQRLTQVGAFEGLSAVLTGYFTSAAQVIAVAKQIVILKAKHQGLHVLVDPVIGDHGQLYVGRDVAETIRDQLLPLATGTTPNLFELTWLAGMDDVPQAVKKLGVNETIVTSIPAGATHLRTEFYGIATKHYDIIKQQGVPNGTGDYLAGCYLGERLNHPAEAAFQNAMVRLEQVITHSAGSSALKLS